MRKTFKRTGQIIFLVVLTIALVAGTFLALQVSRADVPTRPDDVSQQLPIEFWDKDKTTLLGKIYPDEGASETVKSSQTDDSMKQAIVSAEDKTFYENPGFSPKRIAVAGAGHLSGKDDSGGASGITQQLVKNTIVGDEYSLDRKLDEVTASMKMTMMWEKDDILTAYLNSVYFGRGALGVEKAAQAYFDRHADELTTSQSALLAGVVQMPSVLDPALNKQAAQQRFDYVKDQMLNNGYIDQKTHDSMKMPKTIEPKPLNASIGLTNDTGHIVSMALQEIEAQGISKEELFSVGATVVTTIDTTIQDTVSDVSQDVADTNDVKVATVSVEPGTGAIRGIYGGDNGLGLNYATTPQMTGSTFKVFTLAAALENGIGLDTNVSSDPYVSENVTIQNSDGMTCGTCSIAEATKQSLNTSYYRIQDMLPNGPKDTREIARRLGVDAPLSEDDGYVNKGITLGVYGSTPVQMATGYASIASGGMYAPSHIVDGVYTSRNVLIYKSDSQPIRAISEQSAKDIDTALEPIAAYSNGHQLDGKTGYMKTGTQQLGDTGRNRDAWSVGYTHDLSTSVWVGTDDGAPLTTAGGADVWGAGLPSDIWQRVMNAVG